MHNSKNFLRVCHLFSHSPIIVLTRTTIIPPPSPYLSLTTSIPKPFSLSLCLPNPVHSFPFNSRNSTPALTFQPSPTHSLPIPHFPLPSHCPSSLSLISSRQSNPPYSPFLWLSSPQISLTLFTSYFLTPTNTTLNILISPPMTFQLLTIPQIQHPPQKKIHHPLSPNCPTPSLLRSFPTSFIAPPLPKPHLSYSNVL